MFAKHKTKLLAVINDEKNRLSPREAELLGEMSLRVMRKPEGFVVISDAQYAVMSEAERSANNARQRIDYIISKEIEYLLISRKLSEKMVSWFKKHKITLLASHAFGFAGATFSYYLDHADKIDPLVHRLLSGLHFKKRKLETDERPLEKLTPEDLFAEQERFPEVVAFLVELSTEQFQEPTEKELRDLFVKGGKRRSTSSSTKKRQSRART